MSIRSIAGKFTLSGNLLEIERISTGLINQTFLLTCAGPVHRARYILQNLNETVFTEPTLVMENIVLVTEHLLHRGHKDGLVLIPTLHGDRWLTEPDGGIWRCFPFIEGTRSFERISNPRMAFRAGQAFGEFQKSLTTLDPQQLHTTIENFHHTPGYFSRFLGVVERDPVGRAKDAEEEIRIAMQFEVLKGRLVEADLPTRITHNDTKISNVLFPLDETRAATVIDLDTVMPGCALYDYGDLIRSAAANACEDESDLTKVSLRKELTSALTEGYLSAANSFLTAAERALLPISVQVITFELALRFLTDHLCGDSYFRCDYKGQNLVRAKNQLALLKSMVEGKKSV